MENAPQQSNIIHPRYIPQFDGLRGLAILAVLIAHSEFLRDLPCASILQYGRFGVDLFFVLSGFLITGILIDSKGSNKYFRNFYMRRALRIWPLYYLVLAIAFIGGPFMFPAIKVTVARQWPYFLFYVQNLQLHLTMMPALAPTWSLAVEEQFYMTWPVLVYSLNRRTLPWVLFAAITCSLGFRIIGFLHHASLQFIHNFTPSQLDMIAFGCLAALYSRSDICTPEAWRRWSACAILTGGGGTIICRILWNDQSTVISYTFVGLCFTGLLGTSLILNNSKSWFGRLIVSRWLRYIGKISYGLYLVHMPIFLGCTRFLFGRTFPLRRRTMIGNLSFAATEFALAFILAAISWRWFESPLLRLKRHFPSGSVFQRPADEIDLKAGDYLLDRGTL